MSGWASWNNWHALKRVLVVSDSILNSMYLAQRVQSEIPGAQVARHTFGGSQPVMGLLACASSVLSYGRQGNLIEKSDISAWTAVNVTVADAVSPSTGLAVKKLTGDGTAGQAVRTHDSYAVTVPAGAPPMVFCITVEPGSISPGHTLLVRNLTTAGNIKSVEYDQVRLDRLGGLPTPLSIHVKATDGVGYVAGNKLRCQLYVGRAGTGYPAGYVYASNPVVSADGAPTRYALTSGTPEAPSDLGWQTPYNTVRPYDLVVIEGTKNGATLDADEYASIFGAIVDGAAGFAKRVLVCTPPPLANAGLTDWDAADDYVSGGYLDALKTAAEDRGALFFDAWYGFKRTGSAVNALMRDTVHPTDADATSAGMGQYVGAIARAMRTASKPVSAGSTPTAMIGGEPVSGTWLWTDFTTGGTNPGYDAHGDYAGYQPLSTRALACSTVGAQLQWTDVPGTNIGLVIVADNASAGSVEVAIDGGAPVTVNMVHAGLTFYPKGVHIASGLAAGPHTVVATVVSGQARIVGLVAG